MVYPPQGTETPLPITEDIITFDSLSGHYHDGVQSKKIDLTSSVVNNLHITNLASGIGAGATTFWRGDESWQTPGGQGASTSSIPIEVTFGAGVIWTNQPNALTEFPGTRNQRKLVDLTQATRVRLMANLIANPAAKAAIMAQWSTSGITDVSFSGQFLGTISGLPLNSGLPFLKLGFPPGVAVSTGLKTGEETGIVSSARGMVFIRLVGISGDAVADPNFNPMTMVIY